MTRLTPFTTGVSLAVTVAVVYSVCAALYALWPGLGIEFLNSLFHGLDFHKLETAAPWTIRMFVLPLAVLVIWGFAVGSLFAWLHNLLHRSSTHG